MRVPWTASRRVVSIFFNMIQRINDKKGENIIKNYSYYDDDDDDDDDDGDAVAVDKNAA